MDTKIIFPLVLCHDNKYVEKRTNKYVASCSKVNHAMSPRHQDLLIEPEIGE